MGKPLTIILMVAFLSISILGCSGGGGGGSSPATGNPGTTAGGGSDPGTNPKGSIQGVIKLPGTDDHSGIEVTLQENTGAGKANSIFLRADSPDGKYTTLTNRQGEFNFSDVPAGKYNIQAQKASYKTTINDVTVRQDQVTPLPPVTGQWGNPTSGSQQNRTKNGAKKTSRSCNV